MKLKNVLNAVPAMNSLSIQRMRAKLAYAINKNATAMNRELESYSKIREATLLKYGGTLPEGTMKYEFPSEENREAFKKEIDELLETETDFKPHMILLSEFDGIQITPAEIGMLDWLIMEPEDGQSQ